METITSSTAKTCAAPPPRRVAWSIRSYGALAALCAGLALASPASAAEAPRLHFLASANGPLAATLVATPADPAGPAQGSIIEGWGTRLNQAVFDLNIWLGGMWRSVKPESAAGGTAAAVEQSVANLLSNWFNEPLTMLGYGLAGRFDQAGVAAQRFIINTTQGWGGLQDRASERGVTVPPVDLGLSLCALGVPAGPYVMVPVVGPRTLRDAIADLVIANVAINATLMPALGVTPVLDGAAGLLFVDELATLGLARQIDSVPIAASGQMGYDATRTAYLADRQARCERLSAPR